ncbi:MAG: hypothetical protein AB1492_07405 [Bacillota bacterium]
MEVSKPRRVNPHSARILMELAAREYVDENDRSKALDARLTLLVPITAAAILFVGGILARPLGTLQPFASGIHFSGVCLAAAFLLGAQACFIRALKTRDFQRMGLGEWARTLNMEAPAADARAELASLYETAAANNSLINDKKTQFYETGLILASAGVLILAVTLGWAAAAAQLFPA